MVCIQLFHKYSLSSRQRLTKFLRTRTGAEEKPIHPQLPRPAGDDASIDSVRPLLLLPRRRTPVSSSGDPHPREIDRPTDSVPPIHPPTRPPAAGAREIQISPRRRWGGRTRSSKDGRVDVARVVPDVPGAGVQARRGGARQRRQDHHALQAPPRRGRHRRAHHRQQRRGGRLQEPALRGQGPLFSLLPCPPLSRPQSRWLCPAVATGSSLGPECVFVR